MTPTGAMVVRRDRTKLVFILLGGLALTAFCIWLCVVPAEDARRPDWYLRSVGGIGAAFFGIGVALGLKRLFDREPALVIDDKGIVTSSGRIDWSDVRGARLVKIRGNTFIVIDAHDPRRFIDRDSVLLRGLKTINMRWVGSPIAIAMTGLDTRAEDVLAAIECHFDRGREGRVSPPA